MPEMAMVAEKRAPAMSRTYRASPFDVTYVCEEPDGSAGFGVRLVWKPKGMLNLDL